ncbi:hypothetical protein M422DRAFT_185486 [Sphaerobolus stellatus SS14]|uniref:Cytochrome P450 n=1 Tax=Sphaerobolus stellatus (strain SS14) TaxID=990650 RepID=A0A0C9V2M1_SPHS4|nr:hypothetical protein M422DRAFT_185486 [Sphaerobolus stellatus SS14]
MAKKYGPIYQLSFPGGQKIIYVCNFELVDQVCDQKRFRKGIKGTLSEVRTLVGDGLFTAHHGEQAWGVAHRILMPAFSPAKIRVMFDSMTDIANQLIGKFGPDYVIDANEDFTRLTFDTITLCAMSYRLNSFYSVCPCGNRSLRPAFVKNNLSRSANAQFEADKKTMFDLTTDIIKKRKENLTTAPNDLLQLMLTERDPVTGLGMSDENIANNLMTFWIAGHETTSGLLSFTVSFLSSSRYFLDIIDADS